MPSLVRGCTQLLIQRYDEIVLHIFGKQNNLDLIPLPYDSQIPKHTFINLFNPLADLANRSMKETKFQKSQSVVASNCCGIAEYSPSHNSQTIANFDKLTFIEVNGGAMNKTHVLVFHNSLWFVHKVQISCSDPITTTKIKIVPLQKTVISKTQLNHI